VKGLDLAALRERVVRTFSAFTLGQKVVTILAVVGIAVGGMWLTSWSSSTSYAPLFSDLQPGDASAITSELAGRNVGYKLTDGGKTVQVPQKDVYQLRIDLSSKGLPSGGSQGYSLLDKQGITASEFRQRVDYQRALEGELGRTIAAIDGVDAATVHLVIPKDDIFSDDKRKATASVLVQSAAGTSLAPGQVQAIVHLVSSGIEGLAPDDVTVADNKGRVLSAPGQEGAASAEGDARVQKTRGFENDLSTSLTQMLTTIAGDGRAVVRVKAELDFDQRSQTAERIDTSQQPTVIGESSSKETLTGTGAGAAATAGGVLGTQTSAPPAGGGQSGNYNKEDAQRQYAVGKITEQVKAAPGTVKRLSVAVLLDATSPGAADVAAIQKLVGAAAGVDATRGDTVVVDRIAFDTSTKDAAAKELAAAAQARSKAQTMDMVRQVVVGLVVLIVLALALRSTRKALKPVRTQLEPAELERARETLALPNGDELVLGGGDELSEVLAPEPVLELVGGPPVAAVHASVEKDIVDLIERQPEEVAGLLRSWLSER
jgi:flagellar M-ring protein FliF